MAVGSVATAIGAIDGRSRSRPGSFRLGARIAGSASRGTVPPIADDDEIDKAR